MECWKQQQQKSQPEGADFPTKLTICPAALAWGAKGNGKEADMTILHPVGALVKQNGTEEGRGRAHAS